MNGQPLFERILGSLHEAVLDGGLWPETSALIDEACGSRGNFLAAGDGAPQDGVEVFFAHFCYRGERRKDLERRYFEDYHPIDERLPRIRQLADSRIVPVASLYTDEEKRTSPVWNEGLVIGEARQGLNARLDGPDGSRIVWGLADPVDGEGWTTARLETVRHLLPHLRRFVRVRQALVNARALESTVSGLLENTQCGTVYLDPRGRIVQTNDLARAILRKGDALTDRDGRLRAASREDDDALQAMLARALPRFGAPGESGSATVRREALSSRLVLHASPVSGGEAEMRPSRIALLVLLVDPAGQGRIDPGRVEALLGFTRAESQVAVLLAQGRTIRDIAQLTGRTEGTIRWHVKQIFARHGISRQVELVQLVLSLADIPRQHS